MFIVHIAGHLGKDPEVRFTPSGQKVTTFTLATNQRKGKEDVTIWVRVTVWGDRFDKMMSYLKKGSAVIVTGKMNPPSVYTDKEGRTQTTLEVTAEMIEFSPFGKGDRNEASASQAGYSQGDQAYNGGISYEGAAYQAGGHSGYSKSPYGATVAGQGAQSNSVEDDGLPF